MKKNYSKSKDIETISVDFIEQFTRSVVDTTISDVVFKEKTDKIPNDWKEAIKTIKENNDITRLLKSDTRQKSKHGKSYVGFDIFEGKPIIWVANYSPRNRALRINGMEQFVVRVIRDYSAIEGQSPILRNEVTYTDKTRTYLFLGGFGVGNIKNIPSETKSQSMYLESLKQSQTFPFDYVKVQTPKYILENHLSGTIKHNLEVLQVSEMLNKDVADYGNDDKLSDLYPAMDYIPLVAEYIKYFAYELNLDHTRVIGMFSMQDFQNIQNDSVSLSRTSDYSGSLQKALEKYSKQRIMETIDEGLTGEDVAIKKRLIIRTLGAEGSTVQTQNSQLDGSKHIKGLQDLISLIYKVSGYTWSVTESSGTYENVSQTQNTLRSVFETTKEKNELFTRQWKQFFCKLFYVLFLKTKDIKEIERDFDKYVDFQIVSNIILNQNNDWRRTMELHNNNLVSTERAIQLIWPEMTEEDINKEISLIKKQEKQENSFNDFNAFDNQKPFGSNNFNKGDKLNVDE